VGWPAALWIVRHGQSAGNVAADRAEQANEEVVAVVDRDADVPLSALGERQARALGRWFAAMRPEDRPGSILTSPYRRAHRTALIVAGELGGTSSAGVACDERLRERELGAFDRLTRKGWTERYPEQAELRARLGKFYHRPPGGESWCDVVLRLRSFVQDLQLRHEGGRVLVVVGGLRFHAMCPHHLVPFRGVAHVAYIPHGKLVGFGRLADLVDCFTKRLTLQERATHQIAEALCVNLGARGAGCVIEAEQLCLALPGDKHDSSGVVTSAFVGEMRERPDLKARLLEAARLGGHGR
jgi:probable phosphoglycerate mutase